MKGIDHRGTEEGEKIIHCLDVTASRHDAKEQQDADEFTVLATTLCALRVSVASFQRSPPFPK